MMTIYDQYGSNMAFQKRGENLNNIKNLIQKASR